MSVRGHRFPCVLALLLVVGMAAAGAGSPRDAELFWDDGSAEGGFAEQQGRRLAVRFQAPPGAWWLTHVRLYIMDDGLEIPGQPGVPTTRLVTIEVREDTGTGPGGVAGSGTAYQWHVEPGYEEDAWLDFVPPEPVDLADEESFPGGSFYVGIEWEHRTNPVIGLDLDPPIAGESLYWDWTSWTVVDTANVMIRAVVSETDTPAERESWGRVKSVYR